jgi:HlyD family secretion protein
MKRRTKIIVTIVFLAGAGATALKAASSSGHDKKDASVVTVTRGTIVDKALAVGTIQPRVEISVKSQTGGVVRRRFAEEGDYVHAGAPLLEIKPNPTPLELADAQRQVSLADLQVSNAKRELDRQQTLLDQKLTSEATFQDAQQKYQEALVSQQAAHEQYTLMKDGRLSSGDSAVATVVRSPIDGFILQELVEVGDPVVPMSTYQEGTVLVRMAEMKNLIFRGTVDEIDVGRLHEGMPVQVKIGALPDAKVEGQLTKISLKADTVNGATVFPVEVDLTGIHGATLRAGYSANADIIVDRRDSVLMIPERVVTFSGDTASVELRQGDGTPTTRIIKTGLSDALNVQVMSGLAEGDTVLEKPVKEIH